MTLRLLPLKALTLDTPLMLMKPRTGSGLKAIKDSIERDGLFHPLLVIKKRNKYEVIDGKKRLKALRALSKSSLFTRALKKVPCLVQTESPSHAIKTDRPTLMNESELAHAVIKQLKAGVSSIKIAKRFDCDVSLIKDISTLPKLNAKILQNFNRGVLSLEQAAALATIPNPTAQWNLLLQLGPFALNKDIIKNIKNGETVLSLPDDSVIIVPSRTPALLPKFGKTRSPAHKKVFTQPLAA